MKKIVCGAVLAVLTVVAVVVVGTSNPDVHPADQAKLAQSRQQTLAKFHATDADTLADYAIVQADKAWHDGGDYPLAVEWLKVAVAVNPDDHESWSGIAYLQWSMSGDTERPRSHRWWYGRYAVATLREGIAANPQSAEAHFNLGQHYFMAKQYRKAEKWLAKAVTLGADLQGQKTYAHCLEKRGRYEEALAVWGQMDPNGPAVTPNRNKIAKIVAAREQRTAWQRARDGLLSFRFAILG